MSCCVWTAPAATDQLCMEKLSSCHFTDLPAPKYQNTEPCVFYKKYEITIYFRIGAFSRSWVGWIFFYWIFLMKMVKYPQTYPQIPKIPLGWSINSEFWRILICTCKLVKYVVQRFVPGDLIFWTFAYCHTILESSQQPGFSCTQIWAQNSMVN